MLAVRIGGLPEKCPLGTGTSVALPPLPAHRKPKLTDAMAPSSSKSVVCYGHVVVALVNILKGTKGAVFQARDSQYTDCL